MPLEGEAAVDETPIPLTQKRRADPEVEREAAARQQELRKEYLLDVRRAALIVKLGTVMWALCVVFDYVQAYHLGEGDFLTLVALRAVCEIGIVIAAVRLSRRPPPTEIEFNR